MSEWLTPFMDVRTDVDVVAALNKSSGMEGQESNSVSTAIGHLCSQLNQLSDASLGVKATTTPLISVQNLRVVYSVVEILWFWALKGAVTRASGFELPTAPLPKAILVTAKVLNCGVNHAVDNIEEYRLLETVNTIRRVVINDAFSGLMLHRNLDRLLVTYMVLAREISTVSETSHVSNPRADVVNAATVALQDLSTGPFASAVVTKLRSFTKGPPWLRDAALSTLSGILLGPGGLEIVLSGYLEGKNGFHFPASNTMDWYRCFRCSSVFALSLEPMQCVRPSRFSGRPSRGGAAGARGEAGHHASCLHHQKRQQSSR